MTLSPELIAKYSSSGPRYTSYPTAVDFNDQFGEAEWKLALDESLLTAEQNSSLALYLHVPFCKTLCYFCACNKTIPRDRKPVRPYLQHLLAEIAQYELLLSQFPVEQIHWGGGSPNFLLAEELIEIQSELDRRFRTSSVTCERAIELDPRTTTSKQLEALKVLQFNRISIGVQDFDPTVQETINRLQSFEITRDLVIQIRELNLGSLNIDLVYGLPNQTLPGFAKTLEQVCELQPERIALYGYAHITWHTKVQNSFTRSHIPSPEERIKLLTHAVRELESAGYVHIGLDHFALPTDAMTKALNDGTLHRNFMGYTVLSAKTLIGLGASSISSCGEALAQNDKDIESYQQAISSNRFATKRGIRLTWDDKVRGSVIETILCQRKLDIEKFSARWDFNFLDYFAPEISRLKQFVQDGLVTLSPGSIEITPLGVFLLRNIAMVFDIYRKAPTEQPRFSQTV